MCNGQDISPLTIRKTHSSPHSSGPWSHLGVDFITDLSASDGDTCILVGSLKGLPTAMETAEVLFNHVLHNFGIPEDIVSDRGPQFISRV